MKKKLDQKLKGINVVIASHIFATGPALDLEEYLNKKVKSLLFIGHPFSYRKDIRSFLRFYNNGKLKRERAALPWKLPEPILYLKEAFYTFVWIILNHRKIDLYMGSDNYLAFLGVVLKKLGIVKEVILYTIDFTPNRFENPILNSLYHFFDRQCLIHCKTIWNVSEKIAQGRQNLKGLKENEYAPQIIVPLGIWYDRVPKISIEKKDKYTIVFMGHILEKQGLDAVVNALPLISKKVPEVRFTVVGTGPYEATLKNLVKKLKLKNRVNFLGYVENHEDVEKILAQSTVSVATYKPDPESFTYFADPGKIKNYLAAGLPVFVTDVPSIAKVLERKKCGVICKYDSRDISEKISKFLKNRLLLQKYSNNAQRFAKQFDWNIIFENALDESF